jgi:hypothetical protein
MTDMTMLHPLIHLTQSVPAFFRRFLGGPPSINAQNPCIDEELRELRAELYVEYHAGSGRGVVRDDIDTQRVAEEGWDVIVTVLGMMDAAGVTPEQIDAQAAYVAAKLDAKTTFSHRVDPVTGKITRLR